MRKVMTMLAIGVTVMMVDAVQNTDTISNGVRAAQVTTNWEMAQAQWQSNGLFRYDTNMATNIEYLRIKANIEYLKTNALERNRIKSDRLQSPIGSATEPERKGGWNGGYKNLGIRLAAFFVLILVPLWKCAMKANGGRFLLYMCLIVLAIILFLLPFYLNTLADKSVEEARQAERRLEEHSKTIKLIQETIDKVRTEKADNVVK